MKKKLIQAVKLVLPGNIVARLRVIAFLIGKKSRKPFFVQLLMNAGLGMLEVLSIVSVFPFLAVASKPEVIHTNQYLSSAYSQGGFKSDQAFLIALGICLMLVIATTTAVRIIVGVANTKFTYGLSYTLTVALTRNYLRQPYPFFLGEHSSTLHSRIIQDILAIETQIFKPIFQMCASAISVVLVSVALISVNPLAALVVLTVLGGGYGLIFKFLKSRLTALGKEMRENDKAKMRAVQECFSGIKVAKVMGIEDHLLASVDMRAKRSTRLKVTNHLQQAIPVQAMEVMVFFLVITGTLYMVAALDNFADAVPILGLYAFAAYRLKPGLQSIYQASTLIKKGMPRVDSVNQHLLLAPPRRPQKPASKELMATISEALPDYPIIEFRDVQFTYATAPRPTLSNINLAVPRNTTLGIRGATGSGKTTLLDLILGLLTPDSGEIRIDGNPLNTNRDIRQWQARIGYVPQEIYLTDGSIAANIAYGVAPAELDLEGVRRAARMAQIADFIENELPEGYETKAGERGVRLSGGQRQRIGIARALYRQPDVLVFDEATSALDNLTETSVMQAVAALSHRLTIIMVAHRLSTLECCDEIYYFEAGKLLRHVASPEGTTGSIGGFAR